MQTSLRNIFVRHGILARFFITYLALFLLLFSGNIYISNKMIQSVNNHTVELCSRELEKSSMLFLQQVQELRDISYTLAEDPAFLSVAKLSGQLAPADYTYLMKLNEELDRYYVFNDYTQGINIWFGGSGVARMGLSFITPEHPSYEENYRYNNQSYAAFFDAFYQSGRLEQLLFVNAVNANEQEEKLLYCVNLDILSGSHYKVCAFFEIDDRIVQELFTFFRENQNGGILLLNNAGQPLFRTSSDLPFAEGTELPAVQYLDEYLQLNYDAGLFFCKVLVAETYMNQAVCQLRYQLFGLMGVLLLLGLAFSIYFSYRYSDPLQKTINSLKVNTVSPDKTNSSLDTIYQSVQILLRSEEQIQKALEQERELRNTEFFLGLLSSGMPVSEEYIANKCASLGITLDTAYYTAVYLNMELISTCEETALAEKQSLLAWTIVSHTLTQTIPHLLFLYNNHQDNRIALITGLPSCSCTELEMSLRQISIILWQKYQIRIVCSIGAPVERLGLIYEAFDAAKFTLERKSAGGETVQTIHKNHWGTKPWGYTMAVESSLVRCVVAGDTETMLGIIERIFSDITDDSPANLNQMIYSFRGTILRILSEVIGQDVSMIAATSRHITSCQNMQELQTVIQKILSSICVLVQNEEKEKQNDFYKSILQWLRENYHDSNLSLTSVADHFHINEKYLSHFFKETSGTTFSAAVEKVRMDEVIRYMKETNLPVSEICTRCGYSSSNSFYKAFKRVFGTSPNVYRKEIHM